MGRVREKRSRKPIKVQPYPRNDRFTRDLLAAFLRESRRLTTRGPGVTTVYDRLRRKLVQNLHNSGPLYPWNDPRRVFMGVVAEGDVIVVRRYRADRTIL